MTQPCPQSTLKSGSAETLHLSPTPRPHCWGFLKMCPMQPWRRLEEVEGMEEGDGHGQEMGMPDLPKGTQREEGGGQ